MATDVDAEVAEPERPAGRPGRSATFRLRTADTLVAPTREDPMVRTLSEVVGGPWGRRARYGARWWTPVRVLLVVAFVVGGLGIAQKDWCRDNGWGPPGHFTHACYSDIAPLYFDRGLASSAVPYLDQEPGQVVEYPVLTGFFMWVTARLTPGPEDLDQRQRGTWYFDVNALLLVVAFGVAVWATARTVPRRPWDAAILAASPAVLLAGFVNWDLLAVSLLALGLMSWAQRRPALAGMWIGLGAAAKLYPLFVLGPLLLLCLRTGQWRPALRCTVAAAGAWAAVNVPVMLVDLDGWKRFYELSRERGGGFSSPWFVLAQAGHGIPDGALNLVAGGLFVVLCGAVGWLALRAPRRPRLAQLAFLVVAAFLVTNKVYSPQYVVWLVPLAALARPRWRDALIFQAGEVVHFFGIWLYLAGTTGAPTRALPEGGYWLTVAAHLASTTYFAAMVVRDIYRPELDPVRADGSDDPGGGVLDGAADTRPAAPAPGEGRPLRAELQRQ